MAAVSKIWVLIQHILSNSPQFEHSLMSLTPSLFSSLMQFPLLAGIWVYSFCPKVWFLSTTLLVQLAWRLLMASIFLLLLMASGQKSSFLYFCAGWIWGHLNEVSVLWEVMYLLLSLDHHLMNFYVEAVLAVHSFACHWTWAKNINFAICKCLILWLYLNSGLWLFLDFTLNSTEDLECYQSCRDGDCVTEETLSWCLRDMSAGLSFSIH